MLYVGFSRQDMTPNKTVPLAGYGNDAARLSERVLHPVTVTCIAFRDADGTTALVFTQDLCLNSRAHTDLLKKLLEVKLGVSPANVFLHSIHSHEAPSASLPLDHPLALEWVENQYRPAVLRAAEEAIADLAESEIYAGKNEIYEFNYVRRYLDADGNFITRNKVDLDPTGVTHESEPDRELQVLRFARQGKKDIVLVNFQSHPSGFLDGSKATVLSADYPHFLRRAVELSEGVHCAFIQGAAGNLVFGGHLPGERTYKNWDRALACDYYGTELGKKVLEVLAFRMQKLEAGKIRIRQRDVTMAINHAEDGRLEDARAVNDVFLSGDTAGAKALAKEKGFFSIYHCRDICGRAVMPETKSVPMRAMTIGDVGFGFAPYEMFAENGAFVKENSPCRMTFICELTDDYLRYMPSDIAFPHGGYEVLGCLFSRGVGETLAENMLEAIRECK